MTERQPTDIARNKAARLLKRHGSASSLMSGSEYGGGRYKTTAGIMSEAPPAQGDGDKKGAADGASVTFAPDTQEPAETIRPKGQLGRKESRRKLEHAPISSVSTVSFMNEPADPSGLGPKVQLEPTYQLEPSRRFPVSSIKSILGDVLEGYLAEEKYEPELCKEMTKTISDVVKARVKDLQLQRYKIIVLVHIGELRDQGLRISSRCLWDPQNDNSSSYEFRNNSIFGVAQVYGVYHE